MTTNAEKIIEEHLSSEAEDMDLEEALEFWEEIQDYSTMMVSALEEDIAIQDEEE